MSQTKISEEKTKELQQVSLEMAKFFDAFCQKHDLTYFLCGGCCIGAVRSGGFVPWDDDVDVFMPREDYERLKQIWKNTDEYSIQYTTDSYLTANQFLTICANNTTFIKTYQKDMDINHGIMLDVLPIDGCPEGMKRKFQKVWALAYSLFIVGKAPENHGPLIKLCGNLALGAVRSTKARYRMWSYCERKMSQYPIKNCEYVTELCAGPHYMQNEYPKACFSEAKRVKFEDTVFPIPVGYDGYLSMAFGDYMTLPPEDKRVCHHEYEFIDTKRSFREYKGKYYCVSK